MREKEVDAAQECIDYADGSWAELMSTAFAFMDDEERADIAQLEPMWGPVERYSLSEKAEADSKAGSSPSRSGGPTSGSTTRPTCRVCGSSRVPIC
jgi:hypothetical protein